MEEISAAAEALGCRVEIGAELKNYTTFKIGGRCDLLIELRGELCFLKLILLAERLGVPYRIFGKGSHLIVDSYGISGVVFVSGKGFSDIS